MLRPVSGHPQVHNWSIKHVEEGTCIMLVRKTQNY